ncbi:pyrimidine reductase family protein [Pseudonocardia acaciae]|uniref:pyrimidine reductase family protein n=1 Tax=Pseudonocardia acaciae TaxID=551276 RepID=UPI000A6A9D55|nr:pyrimidine reductase family protein [Pseudonocardia acaciae]
MEREALIDAYLVRERATPRVRVNFVTSIDGAVTLGGLSNDLSDPDDQLVFQLLRMMADVVLVGAGTLRLENYNPLTVGTEAREWRRAHGLPEHPVLAVVSGRLTALAEQRAIAAAPVRPIVLTHAGSPAGQRAVLESMADVVVCGERGVDAGLLVDALVARGLPQVLCEGGPELFGTLAGADRVDEVCLSVSPLLAGPGAGRIIAGSPFSLATRMDLRHALAGEQGSVFLRYARAGLDGRQLDTK